MEIFHLHARRRRALGAVAVVCLTLSGLAFTLFNTQVLNNPAYSMQSDQNRLRPLTVPAPRGLILDRNRQIIADNVPGYALSLLPAPEDSIRSTLERLRPYLELTDRQVQHLLERRRRNPQQQLVVSADMPFERMSAIEERRPLFPEVLIEMRPKRNYAAGPAAAHLIGYVGEISESELADLRVSGYRAGQVIGKSGVERQYESRLVGKAGIRYVEVDALGRIVGDYPHPAELPPEPGQTVQVNVDLDLQRWLARIIPDTVGGAMAVLDPATSEVLALYSSPSFDPNELVSTVTHERWDEMRRDPSNPLLDRSISGLYPPGSTWKLATAAIALELGVVDPEARLPLACRGGMRYGDRYFRCWAPAGHGYLNLADAIAHSCGVYFYQLGLQIGLDRLLQEGTRLGFAVRTGVDLPAERSGNFPSGSDWYRGRFGWAPTEAEVLSLAIGQGPNDQTMLKLAQFYAALVTDGSAQAPRVARDTETSSAAPALELMVSSGNLERLREGLRRVTGPGGTAYGSSLEHWAWIGKTGTAQNPHGPDHGLFVGVGGPRGGEPEVVVAVVIEAGERGSDAAQYAAKAADYYLRKKHGISTDTTQTLREHWQRGRPARWAVQP